MSDRITYTDVVHAPSMKDHNEWMPGGYFNNEVFAGGVMFALDRPLKTTLGKPQAGSTVLGFEYGTFTTMLNSGYSKVLSDATGGALDLITSYDFRNTVVMYYTLELNTPTGTLVYRNGTMSYSSDGDGHTGDFSNNVTSTISIGEIVAAYGSRRNLQSLMSTPGLISLGIDVGYGLVKGNLNTSLNTLVSGALIGTVQSMVSGKLTGMVASAFGVTSIGLGLVIGQVVSALVGELTEMALGLDNHFGFGGSYLGTDDQGNAQYADNQSRRGLAQNLKDVVATSYYDITGNLVSFGDNFMDTQYSDSQIDSALGQSIASPSADNPNHNTSGLDFGSGYGDSTNADGNNTSSSSDANAAAEAQSAVSANADNPNHDTSGLVSGSGSGDSGDSGRYCCTVMVKHELWKRRRLVQLGIWDKTQNIIWRTGYPIGGKLVAKVFDRPLLLNYYSKMMDGFYSTHILMKSRTWWTYQAYLYIYPIVYVTGIVELCLCKLGLKRI